MVLITLIVTVVQVPMNLQVVAMKSILRSRHTPTIPAEVATEALPKLGCPCMLPRYDSLDYRNFSRRVPFYGSPK